MMKYYMGVVIAFGMGAASYFYWYIWIYGGYCYAWFSKDCIGSRTYYNKKGLSNSIILFCPAKKNYFSGESGSFAIAL